MRRRRSRIPLATPPVPDPTATSRRSSSMVWTAVLFEAGLGAAACLVGWMLGRPPWELIEWNLEGIVWGLVATLPMLACYAAAVWLPIRSLRRLSRLVRWLLGPLLEGGGWPRLALISAAAGFGEELLFRGLVQNLGQRWLGTLGGLTLASVLFGLVHPLTRLYVVVAAVIGFYLGWLWLATENLLVPIIAHGLYDLVVLLAIKPRSVAGRE
jgi:hypothetical protein